MATFDFTVTGTVAPHTLDAAGIFGPVGGDLSGLPFIAVWITDKEVAIFSGGPPLGANITISNVTFDFGPPINYAGNIDFVTIGSQGITNPCDLACPFINGMH